MNRVPHIGDVACALIERADGRLLIACRPEGKALGGLWEFPGGKVEAGESPVEALHRELDEELGIGVEVLGSLSPVRHAYDSFSLRLVPFRCVIVRGMPVAKEHQALRWVRFGELSSFGFPAADLPVLAEYREMVVRQWEPR